MEPQEYDGLIRQLAAVIAKQETIQENLRVWVQEQRDFNARQLVINQTIETTLGRLEFIQGRIEMVLALMTRVGDRKLF